MIRMTGDQWRLSHTHTYTLQPLMHVSGREVWMDGRKEKEGRTLTTLTLSVLLLSFFGFWTNFQQFSGYLHLCVTPDCFYDAVFGEFLGVKFGVDCILAILWAEIKHSHAESTPFDQ